MRTSDLYRSAARHLFGEVLVNHLTGMKTDQFKVWEALAARQVVPIGGFDVTKVLPLSTVGMISINY